MMKTKAAAALVLGSLLASLMGACSAGDDAYSPPPLTKVDGGGEGGVDPDASTGDDGGPNATAVSCTTTFRYVPPPGKLVKSAEVTGEWNAFAKPGVAMVGPAADGSFSVGIDLPAGVTGYKLLLDGNYEMDPGARLRKYVASIENSAVRVPDCHVPRLVLKDKAITRTSAGQGHFTANVTYLDAFERAGLDVATAKATLAKDGALSPAKLTRTGSTLSIDAPALGDGKYTVLVEANDKAGKKAKPLRLVFWIEAEAFEWRDAVLYMAMTDRFKNGDTGNDPAKQAGVDARADFQGGDFEGVRQAIASGALDQLGVRAIWLTPFNTNPAGSYLADDGVHKVTGYHGYWPVKAREVDARLGGEAALKKMVKEAHAHGIRVLQDFVINHVHKEHEYFTQHPDWFRTGCVCGSSGACDWTARRLDCLFADYLPDVNWTVPEVSEQFGDDAVWWVDTFDLDGLRVDAVKHVEDASIINVSAKLREEFEVAGNKLFLTGETAMGWGDCDLACNQAQYDTISRYVGPNGLDGQFDFVLYHAVPYRTFLGDEKGMIHADYWAQASGWQYPKGSIMTPYVGSHDTPRSVTIASYRNQDGAHSPGVVGNKWDNYAAAPPNAEPYARHRLALSWLMGLPGAPLVYYGDEYGEWGGADPNNRSMWRGEATLNADETQTLALTKKLGQARKQLVALRRGEYRPVFAQASREVLVFARQSGSDVALVALSKNAGTDTVTTALPATIPLPNGTVLHDRLGGPDVTVTNNTVTITLGARGSAILAP
ncbi:MAG: Periplasmic alpha-amylase [Myxococcaceae bacterium]|nr:Periplasmic alpha-amylase [Myxococcaceae bacterium]